MKLIIVSVLLFSLSACSMFRSSDVIALEPQGPSSAQLIDDTALEKKISKNILNAAMEFADSQINVTSHNGWVLLTGQVQQQHLLEQAALVAKNTPETKQVHNHLKVAANRSMIARTNDGWIKLKVRNRLGTDKDFPAQKIIVHVQMGVVYLLGKIKDDEMAQAVYAAEKVKGVQKIITLFERQP